MGWLNRSFTTACSTSSCCNLARISDCSVSAIPAPCRLLVIGCHSHSTLKDMFSLLSGTHGLWFKREKCLPRFLSLFTTCDYHSVSCFTSSSSSRPVFLFHVIQKLVLCQHLWALKTGLRPSPWTPTSTSLLTDRLHGYLAMVFIALRHRQD